MIEYVQAGRQVGTFSGPELVQLSPERSVASGQVLDGQQAELHRFHIVVWVSVCVCVCVCVYA